MAAFLAKLRTIISPRAYRIVRLRWLHGYGVRRIGRTVKIDHAAVSRHLRAARRAALALAASMGMDPLTLPVV